MRLVVVPRSSLIMGEGGGQGDNDVCVVVLRSVRRQQQRGVEG